MTDSYYRVFPKAHPDRFGIYVLQTGDGLEVLTGSEEEIGKHGLTLQNGALRCKDTYLVQEVTHTQAEKAEGDYLSWLGMGSFGGGGQHRTDGGKNFVGGLI